MRPKMETPDEKRIRILWQIRYEIHEDALTGTWGEREAFEKANALMETIDILKKKMQEEQGQHE